MALHQTEAATGTPFERVYDREQVDRLLGVTPALLAEAAGMHTARHTADLIIWHLQQHQVTKPGVHSILRRANTVPSHAIKELLHQHPAFEERRESDDHFRDEAFAAFEQTASEDRQWVAA